MAAVDHLERWARRNARENILGFRLRLVILLLMELSWNENLAVTSLLIILLVIADDDRVHLSELNAHEVPNLHLHFIRMHVPSCRRIFSFDFLF